MLDKDREVGEEELAEDGGELFGVVRQYEVM